MRSVARKWMAALVTATVLTTGVCAAAPEEKPPAEPVSVAVLNYEVTAPGNSDLGSQIADILTVRLSMEDGLELVERAKLDQIIREHMLTLRGLTDQERAARVGRLVGARLMVLGKGFVMDQKLMLVTKVVGVETGVVKGTLRSVGLGDPLSEVVPQVAEDVAGVITKNAARLLPKPMPHEEALAEVLKQLGDRPRPVVAVVVPEEHRRRQPEAPPVDPAVETEIKRALIACRFTVVDAGQNALADWARDMMKGKRPAWPTAVQAADVVVVGEAFSEFALRTGDLVTCTGRAEVNVIDRHTGKVLLADRQTQRAVDVAETTAGKAALEKCGRKLGVAVCRSLVEYKPPSPKTATTVGSARAAPSRRPAWAPRLVLFDPMEVSASARAAPATAGAGSEVKPRKRTVFAAPFENETAEEQYDPAADGMGDLVAVLLAEQENVTVVERQRLIALTAEQARSLQGLTGQKYALQAGKLLKADTVLVGRLFLIDGKLTVSVRALDIETARVAAADQVSCRPEYLMEAALQLARRLAEQMALPLPEIDLKQIDSSPIAGLHFAKAVGHYYTGNLDAAIMQFMRTIDLDPDYTETHYWMGTCYYRLGEWEHALIEWKAYLGRDPKGERASKLKKLVVEAKARAAESTVPRLGPEKERGRSE